MGKREREEIGKGGRRREEEKREEKEREERGREGFSIRGEEHNVPTAS